MKYITSVFIALFAFLFIGFKAECFTFQSSDVEDVPYMKSSVISAYEILQNQPGFTDNYFILLSYSSPTSFNIAKCSFTSSDTITLYDSYWGNCSQPYTYMCRIQSSNPNQISTQNWNSQQVVYGFNSNNNYLLTNTIPVVFNGSTFDPPPDVQGDTFFVTKEGFTNNFGVYCGPGSEYVTAQNDTDVASGYYRTKQYTVHIKFQYQGSTIDFIIPNYLNWLYKYNVYIKSPDDVSNMLDMLRLFTWYAEPVYNTSMQAIRCPVIDTPQLANISNFESMTDYRSFNQITLSQLLSALTPTYSNLTINDLYTVLTFEFYDSDGKKVYSAENDYSSLYNSGVEPTPDPYVTNLTNSTETLNQNITSNNKYLQDIIYGDVYEPFPYEQSIKDAGSVNLDLISVPDYSYEKHNIDTSATSFFGRLVEWWYIDTPFGMIAIVALTFLVIRVILW